MYQAQITRNDRPVDSAEAVARIARTLGDGTYEADDPQLGGWLISLSDYNETRLEQDGYLGVQIGGYIVEIEMP